MFTYKHDCIFVAYIVSYLDWVWLYTTSIKGDWGQWLLLWPFSFVPIFAVHVHWPCSAVPVVTG